MSLNLKELQNLINEVYYAQSRMIKLYNQCKQLNKFSPYENQEFEFHLLNLNEINTHINRNIEELQKRNPNNSIGKNKKSKHIELEEINTLSEKTKHKKKFKNPYARNVSTPMYS
ncbi:MAG: hypothetical protein M3R72_02305 [Bacteroidota bacterium]|nr:hypothetical protein [Bacteroidota bacterium]